MTQDEDRNDLRAPDGEESRSARARALLERELLGPARDGGLALLDAARVFAQATRRLLVRVRAFRPLAWLRTSLGLELAVCAGVLALSAAHCARSAASMASLLSAAGGFWRSVWSGDLMTWVGGFTYYPPLYTALVGLCPWPFSPDEPLPLLLWIDLLLLLSMLALARSLGDGSTKCRAGVMFLLLLLGTKLATVYTKIFHLEAGMLLAVCPLLALLLRSAEGLPRGFGAIALGGLVGAGMLFKWTFLLHAAGPIVIAAWSCFRRAGPRETAWRLGAAAVTAGILCAPWYLIHLDWERVAISVANDPTPPGETFESAYVSRLHVLIDGATRTGLGWVLAPVFLIGVALACVRRLPQMPTLLSSAALPIAVYPLFGHVEIRYLLAALPGLAATAALGLDGARRSWRRALLLTLAAAAGGQSLWTTWSASHRTLEQLSTGPHYQIDSYGRLMRPSRTLAPFVLSRMRSWSERMDLGPGRRRFLVHSAEAMPDLKGDLFGYFDGALPADFRRPAYVGHDWASPRQFLADLSKEGVTFLVLSEATLRTWPSHARSALHRGWHFVPLLGDLKWQPGDGLPPPDDPFFLEPIVRHFGVLEAVATPWGACWILVRRSTWSDVGEGGELGELPHLERWLHEPGSRAMSDGRTVAGFFMPAVANRGQNGDPAPALGP